MGSFGASVVHGNSRPPPLLSRLIVCSEYLTCCAYRNRQSQRLECSTEPIITTRAGAGGDTCVIEPRPPGVEHEHSLFGETKRQVAAGGVAGAPLKPERSVASSPRDHDAMQNRSGPLQVALRGKPRESPPHVIPRVTSAPHSPINRQHQGGTTMAWCNLEVEK